MSLPLYERATGYMFSGTHPLAEPFTFNGTAATCFVTEEDRMSSQWAARYLGRYRTAYCRTSDLGTVQAGDAFVLTSGTNYVQGVETTLVGTTTLILNGSVSTLIHSSGTYPVFKRQNYDDMSAMMEAGYEASSDLEVMLSHTLAHNNQVRSQESVTLDGTSYTVGSPIRRTPWYNVLPLMNAE